MASTIQTRYSDGPAPMCQNRATWLQQEDTTMGMEFNIVYSSYLFNKISQQWCLESFISGVGGYMRTTLAHRAQGSPDQLFLFMLI